MAMSRKHYTEVAEIVKSNVQAVNMLDDPMEIAAATSAIKYMARDLAVFFARDNSAFDRARFMDACGFGD